MSKTEAQTLLETHMEEVVAPACVWREHLFCPPRRWKFDFAVVLLKLAVELEGGIWINGRHTRGKGYQADLDKYNMAAVLGWTVFRFSTEDVLKGRDVEILKEWLCNRRVA